MQSTLCTLLLDALLALTATALSLPSSLQPFTQVANGSSPADSLPFCVDNRWQPTWSGSVEFQDCTRAYYGFPPDINQRRYVQDIEHMFYSDELEPHPRPGAIKLPISSTYGKLSIRTIHLRRPGTVVSITESVTGIGDCTLIVRMARDFGDNALPVSPDHYLSTSRCTPTTNMTWRGIFDSLSATITHCLDNFRPGWAPVAPPVGYNLIVLAVPTKSGFTRRWMNSALLTAGSNSSTSSSTEA